MTVALVCAALIALILAASAIATIRADRASHKRVWSALDRTIENRSRSAGTP